MALQGHTSSLALASDPDQQAREVYTAAGLKKSRARLVQAFQKYFQATSIGQGLVSDNAINSSTAQGTPPPLVEDDMAILNPSLKFDEMVSYPICQPLLNFCQTFPFDFLFD